MVEETLSAALEREHHEIDDGIEAFRAGLERGENATDPLTRAMAALRRHIYLEEEFLFPPLRQSGLVPPIFVMIREHGEMWRTLDSLEEELAKSVSGAPVSDLLKELVDQLEAHNSKEEAIIYPQADSRLDDFATERLRTFIAGANLPDGWVCQGARG